MTTRRRLLFAGASLALLSSCGPPPEVPKFPNIRFDGETPILLEASQIDIRTLYQPTDYDHLFPVPPLQALLNWAHDRLRASGHGGSARFTITNASTSVKDLSTQGGISGTFTDQLSQQYDIALDVTLDILDTRGMVVRTVHVTASRTQSVLQSASPNDRERVRYELVKTLMASFDQQIDQQIRDNFGLYLLSR
jgi:hypothetical protein